MFDFFRRRKEDRELYSLLKDIFGLKPKDIEIYKLALIHRSASRFLKPGPKQGGDQRERQGERQGEKGRGNGEFSDNRRGRGRYGSRGVPINNERLEFLGDAVIESVVSNYLFAEFPHEGEGFLTRMRSRMVNRATLNELCKEVGLAKHIRSKASGGGEQRNMHGDAFEAIIGAMYLDRGYEFTNKALMRLLLRNFSMDDVCSTETDFKSRLIEWCQRGQHRLRFVTSFSEGARRNAPTFRSVVFIDDMELGYGIGNSKKEAEQHAAYTVSQAIDDGDRAMDMMDEAEGVVVKRSDGPKKRRHRGGRKHRKPGQGTGQGAAQGEAPHVSDAKPDEIIETSVADGVVSVSVETVGSMPEGTVVPVKRKPGRPKKVVAETPEKAKPAATEKKPRGRKPAAAKKTEPAKETKPDTEVVTEQSAKRKPGRPKKVVTETQGTAKSAKPAAAEKKPRGRKPAAKKAAEQKKKTEPTVNKSAAASTRKPVGRKPRTTTKPDATAGKNE